MTTRPLRRSDVWTVAAAGEALVYEPGRRRLHRLNPSAAAVWDLADGSRSPDEIAHDAAGLFDVPSAEVADDVTALLHDLRDEGLLDGTESGAGTGPDRPAFAAPSGTGLARAAERILRERTWPYEMGPFEALDLGFSVRTDADDVAAALDDILRPLGTPTGAVEHHYTIRSFSGGYLLSLDGRRIGRFARDRQVVGHLLWHVNQMTISLSRGRTLFHAAGLVRDGRALLLPGTSNAGKSTLAAALVGDGYDYLSDEAVALGPDDDTLFPFPKALTLQRESVRLLGLEVGTEIGADRHVPAEAIRPGSEAAPGRLRLVVSPRHRAGAQLELTRLTGLDALALLLESAFHLGPGREEFDRLATLAATVPTYALRFDTLASARREIDRLMSATGDPPGAPH